MRGARLSRSHVNQKGLNKQGLLWGGVLVLLILQVAWWATVFTQEVQSRAELRIEILKLQSGGNPPADQLASIESEASRRKIMFTSESLFFVLLTCTGIWLLYRALRAEALGRETQRSFIEIVSHESKTPLTALKLRLESVISKRAQDPTLQKELSASLDEVRRLSSLVDKALSLNRLEREVFHFEPVYMAEIAELVARRMDPVFRDKAVSLHLDLDAEAVVSGDEQGLQNTVQSLLENAVVYNDQADRKVWLSVKGQGGKVVVTVADNGPGVPAADSARVFERFFRGRGNSAKPGSGLGLYIARTIVEAHGGALKLSERSGGGAQFEVVLPGVGTA